MRRPAYLLAGVAATLAFAATAQVVPGGLPSRPQFQAVGIGVVAPNAAFKEEIDGTGNTGLRVVSNTSGDAYYIATASGINQWSAGTRRSDAAYVISNAVDLSAPKLTISIAGVATVPGVSTIACSTACAAALAVGQSAVVLKGTSTSRASVTVDAVDPDLQFTSVPAGTYTVSFNLNFSFGGGGVRFIPNGTGVTGIFSAVINCQGGTGSTPFAANILGGNDFICATGSGAVGGGQATLTTTGGTVGLNWAQDVSNAANTTLAATSSSFSITRIQ